MQVEEFFFELPDAQKETGIALHDLFTEGYHLSPKLRYRIPFYYQKSWICYINPLKNGWVELGFPRGCELENAGGLLKAYGRKQVMSLRMKSLEEVDMEALEETMNEAIILDRHVKYNVRRKKPEKPKG